MRDQAAPVAEPNARPIKREPSSPDRPSPLGRALPGSTAGLRHLQRSDGNRAVAQLAAGCRRREIGRERPVNDPVVQRLALTEGPPLAPGSYRYGSQIVSLDKKGLQQPKPVSAGQATIAPSMPGSDDLRGVMRGQENCSTERRS